MTDQFEHFAKELEWVAGRLRAGRAGEQEIESLVNVISIIRSQTTPTNSEEEIVSRYLVAKTAETVAVSELAAYFWPLVKAATTEAEARDILNRVPGVVEKAFFIDHFVYVSKVIPRAAPEPRTEAR